MNDWLGRSATPKRLFSFGKIGAVNRHRAFKKLDNRGEWVRYVYPYGQKHIIVLCENGNTKRIRVRNFKSYEVEKDPEAISDIKFTHISSVAKAFKAQQWHPILTCVTPTTPASMSLGKSRRYLDAAEWGAAHEKELEQLDEINTIKWLPPVTKPTYRPLTITMRYRCK